MSFTDRYSKIFRYLLPAPFTIAVLLTVITFLLAFFITKPIEEGHSYAIDILTYWENGLWNQSLMVFAMQMMLMLVLGHTVALSKPVNRIIFWTVRYCNNTAKAALIVTFLTLVVSLFNWGLGLIFGAILARKVGEYATQQKLKLNYPLIGAAGYSGLMVWHGGISGSSLTKIAETGHIKELMAGLMPADQIKLLPEQISFSETVFDNMNIIVSLLLLILLPISMYLVGKKASSNELTLHHQEGSQFDKQSQLSGAEKIDHAHSPAYAFGIIIILFCLYKVFILPEKIGLGFITPNFINFFLLGIAVLLHGSFNQFLKAVDLAISGASGILIQFPLYFGIMGIMKSSGLVSVFSNFFISISSTTTFPIFTFLSAGIVNIFVPSGGGQWALQGPIIIQTALDLGIPFSKSIMAFAYGDQITNMLQPFWALPLLGITGLKAKELLPYTIFLMAVGGLIFISALLFF